MRSPYLGLLAIPIGTLVHAAALIYLFQPYVKAAFAGLPPPSGTRTASPLAITGIVLAVLAVPCGVLSLIAVPNVLNGIQRGKQKRTLGDLRTLSTAVEAYAVDHNSYPDVATVEELRSLLEPKYIKKVPMLDAWNRPLCYEAPKIGNYAYMVRSAGKDGIWEHEDPSGYDARRSNSLDSDSFDSDIVLAAEKWVDTPEGSSWH